MEENEMKRTMKMVREDIRYWIVRNFDLLTTIITVLASLIGGFLGALALEMLIFLFPELPAFLGLILGIIIVVGSMLGMAYLECWVLELLTLT